MTEIQLFKIRIALVQAFLQENGYDGVLLMRQDNYAMATGGRRNYICTQSDFGASGLFVTAEGRTFFVGNNIEATRQMEEELKPFGCEVLDFLWFENTPAEVVRKRFSGRLVSDDGSLGPNVNNQLASLRAILTRTELEKYRQLGALAAEAMTEALYAITPGMAEADVAALLVAEGAKRRCLVNVALVAADKRIAKFRHPLPTERPMLGGSLQERSVLGYVMVVGGFSREGLVASITRFCQVGAIPADIPDAYGRICAVEAIMQEETRPGRTLGRVFSSCQQAYADMGFATDEWHRHHQGGATGYGNRTCKGAPEEGFLIGEPRWTKRVGAILGNEVEFGMAFAWNPTAPGVKSEDTFIINPDGGAEIVTKTPRLPQVDLGRVLGRETDVVKSGILTRR